MDKKIQGTEKKLEREQRAVSKTLKSLNKMVEADKGKGGGGKKQKSVVVSLFIPSVAEDADAEGIDAAIAKVDDGIAQLQKQRDLMHEFSAARRGGKEVPGREAVPRSPRPVSLERPGSGSDGGAG